MPGPDAMADSPSVTTFVIGPRLPWPDDAMTSVDKGPFDSAVIHGGDSTRQCAIRRISELGATLHGQVGKAKGERIAIELPTGQRPAATIDWIDRGEAGVRFSRPVDMIALINRTLVSQPVERRTMPRVELRCAVHLKCGANFVPATLRNISASGVQIEGEGLPAAGTYVQLFIEGLNVPAGEIVWRKNDLAGIELFEELSWTSLMPWIRQAVRGNELAA